MANTTITKRVRQARPLPDLDALPRMALLTREDVCRLSNFSLPTLKAWAARGRGPRITVVEGRPRFTVGDVIDWQSGNVQAREVAGS